MLISDDEMRVPAVLELFHRGAGGDCKKYGAIRERADMGQDVVQKLWFDMLQYISTNNEVSASRNRIFARDGGVVF